MLHHTENEVFVRYYDFYQSCQVLRFYMISRYIHLADNNKMPIKNSPDYKLYKLGNIQDTVNRQSKIYYFPVHELYTDEQMVGTKIRINFLQSMSKKPRKTWCETVGAL